MNLKLEKPDNVRGHGFGDPGGPNRNPELGCGYADGTGYGYGKYFRSNTYPMEPDTNVRMYQGCFLGNCYLYSFSGKGSVDMGSGNWDKTGKG